jgi:hypothetical protein
MSELRRTAAENEDTSVRGGPNPFQWKISILH